MRTYPRRLRRSCAHCICTGQIAHDKALTHSIRHHALTNRLIRCRNSSSTERRSQRRCSGTSIVSSKDSGLLPRPPHTISSTRLPLRRKPKPSSRLSKLWHQPSRAKITSHLRVSLPYSPSHGAVAIVLVQSVMDICLVQNVHACEVVLSNCGTLFSWSWAGQHGWNQASRWNT